MLLPSGTLLQGGKYRIIRHIASGGFGNTYEAVDTSMGNTRVAIKEFFVKDFCGRNSETTFVSVLATTKTPLIQHLKKKFIEEAHAIAGMKHDNIVKVYSQFEENGTAYYVMDFIEGESLGSLLKRRGSLTENEALNIIRKVASALDHMHKQNRYHLDVKPDNIMLRNDGEVVLIDFGSSKQYAEVGGENTTTLPPCYTPGYAPLEQMNPKPTRFTAATDVYSLGTTLYKMLTGLTPPSAIDLIQGNVALSPLPPEISSNVRTCVEKAMIPQRNMRVQSIGEFEKKLKGGIVPPGPGPTSPGPDPKPEGTSMGWLLVVLLVVGAIVAALVFIPKNKVEPPIYAPDTTATVTAETDTAVVDTVSKNTARGSEDTAVVETTIREERAPIVIHQPSRHDILVETAKSYGNQLVRAILNNNLPEFRAVSSKFDETFKDATAAEQEEVDNIIMGIFRSNGITEDDIFAFTEQDVEGY